MTKYWVRPALGWFIGAAATALIVLSIYSCSSHKKKHEAAEDTPTVYTQPDGPTSGLVKIIDISTTDEDKQDCWWYWFEFISSDHQVKEYRICRSSDFIAKGMAGNISLQWQAEDNCFKIAQFNRREEEEDKDQ